MTVLAFDIGRTTCRAAVFDGTNRTAAVTLDSGVTVADPNPRTRLADLVETCARTLGADAAGSPDAIVVAAAGALSRPAAAEALADSLAASSLAAGEVVITTDVVAAHSGMLHGSPGVVLSAGTGAVALTIDAAGRHTIVDGAGYLIGDAGGGFAVGRAGLAQAIRHADGRGGSAALAALAEQQFGALDELPGRLHGGPDPARNIAAFAPAVAAAARDGDECAMAIWRDAVAELATTIEAACAVLPERDQRVALTGGLVELNDLITDPLEAVLKVRCPNATLRRGRADTLRGAARLAGQPAGVYENLLLRRPVMPARSGQH